MNIGIIGSGNVGGTLGIFWSLAGHSVLFSSRHPEQLVSLLREAEDDARTGTVAQAAQFGDVVVFALPFWMIDDAIAQAGPWLDGKIIIDTTNPYARSYTGLALPATKTGGEELAKKLPQVRLVKAYNMISAELLLEGGRRLPEAERIIVFYCGDDPQAKAVVNQLISDSGFAGFDIGPLKNAAYLEPRGELYGQVVTLEQAHQMLTSIG